MKHFRVVSTRVDESHLFSIECDKCKKLITEEKPFQLQEVLRVSFSCGYGSIFGDMTAWECELCQECVKEVLGEYLRKTWDG